MGLSDRDYMREQHPSACTCASCVGRNSANKSHDNYNSKIDSYSHEKSINGSWNIKPTIIVLVAVAIVVGGILGYSYVDNAEGADATDSTDLRPQLIYDFKPISNDGIPLLQSPTDLVYLAYFQHQEDSIPDDQIQVLVCNTQGALMSVAVEKDIFDSTQTGIHHFSQAGKNAVAVTIEIYDNQAVTFPMEIDSEEASAIRTIVETFIETQSLDSVPKELVEYPERILKRGQELVSGS